MCLTKPVKLKASWFGLFPALKAVGKAVLFCNNCLAEGLIGDGPRSYRPRSPVLLLSGVSDSYRRPVKDVKIQYVCPGNSSPAGCHCLGAGGPEACGFITEWASSITCPAAFTGRIPCVCSTYGPHACLVAWRHSIENLPVGAFTVSDFNGSPQQHAILNRHLLDYFKGRTRSQETTRYAIPASQLHLLPDLGMEAPQPDAPVVPHGLHKSIEEAQLSRMRNYLPDDDYNLICAKDSKVHLLPKPASRQNPIREAKDSSRFPGWAIKDADLSVSKTHFMHDVASEVTPHELVEKLSKENPEAHLFVTGMNPAEVIDRAVSFEPASHSLEYDSVGFSYIFTGSVSEAYYTPIDVTLAWIHTSSVCASNGVVYHVVLLDNKLGHCMYHIFCGDVTPQHTRLYSTGSMVRLPPAVSGTLSAVYVPSQLLSSCVDFVHRTPDTSHRNFAAKVSMVANATNPRTTSKERWAVRHVMSQVAPSRSWTDVVLSFGWKTLYLLSFQWQMFAPVPDIYDYINERERHLTVHPTQGGGWSPNVSYGYQLSAIPNMPTMLQRVSAFTASAFVYLWPKLVLGEVLSTLIAHTALWDCLRHVVGWMDVEPLRAMLTVSIVIVSAILPSRVIKFFTGLSSHFSRQLWWPGWLRYLPTLLIVELSGAPGATLLGCPGRGWAWQLMLWSIAVHSVFPGLVPALVVPWIAYKSGWGLLMTVWLSIIGLENVTAARARPVFTLSDTPFGTRHYRTYHRVCDAVFSYPAPGPTASLPPFVHLVTNDLNDAADRLGYCFKWSVNCLHRALYKFQRNLGNCGRVPMMVPLPAKTVTAVRVRNVDRVLPAVVIQPSQAVAPLGVSLAIPPDGLNFPEWLEQVEEAYNNNPRVHPLLTPGQDCFWQTVASLGGTPHMWFCWYMEFMRLTIPATQTIIGNMTIINMHKFASISGLGLRITGFTDEVTIADKGRPTLNVRITSTYGNSLHAELAITPVTTGAVQTLARLLRSISRDNNAWFGRLVNAHQAAPLDSVVSPTAHLKAIAGVHQLPLSRSDVSDAINLSYSVLPIAANDAGYAYTTRDLNAGGLLYEYLPPVNRLNVAHTVPSTMWRNFGASKSVGANKKEMLDNVTRNNARPEPPAHVTLGNELAASLKAYSVGTLPAAYLEEEVVYYTADVSRAARLVSDLKAHPAVLGGKADAKWLQSLDSVLDLFKLENRTVTVPVRAYFGVSGCGKTSATVDYLRTLEPSARQMVRVVSHTESLRAQAKSKIDFSELRGVNFPTIPGLISEPTCGPIVFDDAGKFWGGVLDLVLLCNPLVPEVVINGDPAQATAKFPVSGTQSEYDVGPLVVAQQTTKYATVSYRLFGLMAEVLGVHTTNPTRGHLTHSVGPKSGIPVCTASPRYAQVLASGGRHAYTYDSVQGEDFDVDVEVDMSALEEAVTDRTAYVALTRSKVGVYLHMNAADPHSRLKAPPTGSDLLNAILYSMRRDNLPTLLKGNMLTRAAFYAHLHSCMPNLKWFQSVGATMGAAFYQSIVPACETTFARGGSCAGSQVLDYAMPSTAPVETSVLETHWNAKEFREARAGGEQTDQFKETCFVDPHVHKRRDTATYKLTKTHRITNVPAVANYTRKKKCARQDMIDEFHRLCPVLPKWTPAKHADYMDRARVEYEQSRSAAAVTAKVAAHDPDRSGCDVKNSLKAQVIKKDEKRGKNEAIPGQMIYEYDISQTLEDAAYALFLEEELFAAFPECFLFYRRMNPDEFEAAYAARWRVNNGVYTSDVTKWDVGCDAGVLNFDEDVFRSVGFPTKYVDDYVHRRLNTRSQHGNIKTSQPSGDRYTWTMNTIRRAVVTSIVLHVKEEDTVAINGDDAAMDRMANADTFPDSPWVFKNLNGMRGGFSGYELGGPVPTYSARELWYRTAILMTRDPSAVEKWVNYLGLLARSDPDSWEAMDIARMAYQHMPTDQFYSALPQAFHIHFPIVK